MTSPELADDIRATVQRLARAIAARRDEGEMSTLHHAVLAGLDLKPGQSNADIAKTERVSPQAINVAVRSLVEQGLVNVAADPLDARRRMLSLTDEGRTLIHRVRDDKNAWLGQRLAALTDEERGRLAGALEVMHKLLDMP